MSRIRHENILHPVNYLFCMGFYDIDSFFPQMKPEKQGVVLTDSEKTILEIVKAKSKIDLKDLKGETGLSGKQYDKGMKGLNKHGLIRVEVEGDDKFCVFQG